jgi:hypothetical protein
MDPLIGLIRSEDFEQEVIAAENPVLVLCMPGDQDLPGQLQLLQEMALKYGQTLKVRFLHENFIEPFKMRYNVLGTPTILIFLEGEERARMLGLANKESLMDFVSQLIMPISR